MYLLLFFMSYLLRIIMYFLLCIFCYVLFILDAAVKSSTFLCSVHIILNRLLFLYL